MNTTQAAILRRNLQNSINQVADVFANTVVMNEAGEIEEIHVMASPRRHAKQIVRDIESLLMVKFHMRVDYRKVSLVQAEEEKIIRMLGARPKLRRVTHAVGAGTATAEVLLEDDQTPFEGRASAPEGEKAPEALAAEAALEALAFLTGEEYEMVLSGLQEVEIGGKQVFLAIVTLNVPGGEEVLIGTAFLREDRTESAARAVLDAVNRRLAVLRQL